ncbi:hypothetical protein AAG906_038314 [Vitis piasezkii]
MYFDGAANHLGYGIGVLLVSPQGDHIPRSVRVTFFDYHSTTNNIVEYKACIISLKTALELGITQMDILGDSNLVLKQVRDLIHVPPLELHALTSLWPFSVWGIDIIGKISPKSSNGHEFILVAIDYFTKWVEAASYAKLTSARVVNFIRSHIICRYGAPHELISDRGKYDIQHHKSSAYRLQTNGAVEAANNNIKRIMGKMV